MQIRLTDVPYVGSYEDAKRLWAGVTPWRGETEEGDERPLTNPGDGSRKRHFGVRKTKAGAFAFRYHRTDVVTWVSPRECHVYAGGWGSVNTQSFANNFCPGSVSFARNMRACVIRRVGIYPCDASDTLILKQDKEGQWGLTGNTAAFIKDRVDRAAAKEVLEAYNWYAFRDYYKIMVAMMEEPPVSEPGQADWRTPKLTYYGVRSWKHLLADESRWHESWTYSNGSPEALRRKIYAEERPYRGELVDKLPSTTAWSTLISYRIA